MIKTLNITDVGVAGINTDLPAWALAPSYITAGRRFHVQDNKLISIHPSSSIRTYSGPTSPGRIFSAGNRYTDPVYIGATNGVWVSYNNSTITQIVTVSPAVSNSKLWSFCQVGPIVYMNHPDKGAWYTISGTTTATRLPFDSGVNWDGGNGKYSKLIRAHKNYLFMLGLTEGATSMPDSFRWSHPADANAVPVSWDETDTDFIAGLAQLGSKSYRIIDALSLRESFIIYSGDAISILNESGDALVWNRTELTTTTGLLNKECVTEVAGAHFAMCIDDIVTNSGIEINSLITASIRTHLINNVNSDYAEALACVTKSNQNKEIWFCYPKTGTTTGVDLFYIYNWQTNSWSINESDTPASHLCEQWVNKPYTTAFDTSIVGITPSNGYIDYQPMYDPNVFNHDYSGAITVPSFTSGNSPYLERQNYQFGDLKEGATILSFRPKLKGKGTVTIEVGSHAYAGAPVVWQSPVDFDIRDDTKVDVRCTGKLHAWRITGKTGSAFEFSGMDVDVATAGVR